MRCVVRSYALVLDGVFAEDDAGGLCFHAAPPPTDEDIDGVLARSRGGWNRLLARRGVVEHDAAGDGDPWSEREPVLAGLSAASVQGRLVLGARPAATVRRYGSSPELAATVPMRGPCQAHHNGFDLHAGLVVPARDRARLERTCRYALRPPVADDRIRITETGQVLLELRHRPSTLLRPP
jgi:hypothetical protein